MSSLVTDDPNDDLGSETDFDLVLGTSGTSGSGEGVMLNFFISWDIKGSDFDLIGTSLEPDDAGDPWEPE